MITGALLDCGADRDLVVRAMRAVVAEPGITQVTRAGIRALKVDTHAPPTHRTLEEVMKRLEEAAPHVPAGALAMARRVFLRISRAEEEIHGARVHFHEVGADDAIADVIGSCTALYSLGVEGVKVLPIALGSGTGKGSHGVFPIPAPATTALLKNTGLRTVSGSDDGELCTPTGAALLAEFSTITAPDTGAYTIEAVGYGAGSRDSACIPNVLRALVVETAGQMPEDTVDVLETSIDDVSGEVIAHAITRFMDAGARDASAMPLIMKKGRPGFLIRVISLPEKSVDLARLMAEELGTLGIRCIPAVHRFIAERSVEEIQVEIAGQHRKMPVKCGLEHGRVYTLKAEFDPASSWAAELGLPVRRVLQAVEEAAWDRIKNQPGVNQVTDED